MPPFEEDVRYESVEDCDDTQVSPARAREVGGIWKRTVSLYCSECDTIHGYERGDD